MTISPSIVFLLVGTACSFTPHHVPATRTPSTTFLAAREANDDDVNTLFADRVLDDLKKAATAAVVAATLWTSPVAFVGESHPSSGILEAARSSVVVNAKEMASGSGSRVNKDAESLLRYGLPIKNKEMRTLQATVENIKQDVASKRKTAALDGMKETRKQLEKKASKISASCRDQSFCTSVLNEMSENTKPLEEALRASVDTLAGSEQERAALDKAYNAQIKLSRQLTTLEEQMVPAGYEAPVPEIYSDLPQLKGRATVEMVLKKPQNAPFDVEGTNFPEAKMTMVIDGFTAPVTGGNFIDLVDKGFYTNMAIQRSDGFVVQTGKPSDGSEGYTGGRPSKSIGQGPKGERLIPSEIFVVGDQGPFYETTIEDEGRGGQATVLPFSSYGAMGWAREEYDANTGSSQFFWLLFDSDLTPAGKNVLDGRYPCFGYVVEGADFLRDIKEGDIITTAKVTSGLDLLKQPVFKD